MQVIKILLLIMKQASIIFRVVRLLFWPATNSISNILPSLKVTTSSSLSKGLLFSQWAPKRGFFLGSSICLMFLLSVSVAPLYGHHSTHACKVSSLQVGSSEVLHQKYLHVLLIIASLYIWMSFCFSSFFSTQYSLKWQVWSGILDRDLRSCSQIA